MTDQQLTLDGTSVALGRQAPRQDAVLALLRQHPGGCSADEIGAAVHGSAGKHDADSVCAWCAIDARPVLLSLIRKKLVTHTSGGQFMLKTAEPSSDPGEDIPY